ncbi:efflux RND transporter permease subunit, partial [Patescibacteria group bacterium]
FITEANKRENNDKTIFDIEDELAEKVKGIVVKAPEGTYITVTASHYGPPAAYYDVTIELKGKDIENLEKAALDLDKFVKEKDKDETFNIKRIKNEVTDELVPTTEVTLNKNKASQYGVTPFVSSTIINSIFSESKVGKLTTRDDGVSDNLVMKFSDDSRDSVEDLENVIVTSQGRQLVRLKTIANVKSTDKSFNINHIDGQRSISYQVALEAEGDERTKLAGNLEKEIQNYLTEDKLEEFELDKDDVSYGGFISEINTNFNDLIIIFILAMLAVFIILVYQFNSYIQPLMIMFTIPIALIGVFPGLWIIGGSVNMISGLGIIALVGIVVNDAIVFIDYYNRQTAKRPNASILQNLVYTGKVRFRPIFSTSITTIAGVLPITIIDPFWRGLGTAICCGLVFSTIGTLVILPILLSTYAKVKERIKKKRRKK